MKILVFADVHGNLPAFETMLRHAGNFDSYICLGDLVNYGPWNNECVELALSLSSCKYIMGNHEEAFINGFYPGDNILVKTFFKICYGHFTKLDEIKAFEEKYEAFGFSFRHTIYNSYIYPDTTVHLDGNYIIGHSHHQFRYQSDGFELYNTGSVGQNRKYINVINYLEFYTEDSSIIMRSLKYDVDILISEMTRRKYPIECIEYYAKKERL